MVSTHSNYRKGAFDNFDTIFMTGPYQREEIRSTEKVYGLNEKELIDFGYPRLERLMENVDVYRKKSQLNSTEGKIQVMLAPSWGENSILECKHTYESNTMSNQLIRYMPQLQFYMYISRAN